MVDKSTLMDEPHRNHGWVALKNVQGKSTLKKTQLKDIWTLWKNLEKEASQNECWWFPLWETILGFWNLITIEGQWGQTTMHFTESLNNDWPIDLTL